MMLRRDSCLSPSTPDLPDPYPGPEVNIGDDELPRSDALFTLVLLRQQRWRTFSGALNDELEAFLGQFAPYLADTGRETAAIVAGVIIDNLRCPQLIPV